MAPSARLFHALQALLFDAGLSEPVSTAMANVVALPAETPDRSVAAGLLAVGLAPSDEQLDAWRACLRHIRAAMAPCASSETRSEGGRAALRALEAFRADGPTGVPLMPYRALGMLLSGEGGVDPILREYFKRITHYSTNCAADPLALLAAALSARQDAAPEREPILLLAFALWGRGDDGAAALKAPPSCVAPGTEWVGPLAREWLDADLLALANAAFRARQVARHAAGSGPTPLLPPPPPPPRPAPGPAPPPDFAVGTDVVLAAAYASAADAAGGPLRPGDVGTIAMSDGSATTPYKVLVAGKEVGARARHVPYCYMWLRIIPAVLLYVSGGGAFMGSGLRGRVLAPGGRT